MATNVHIAGFPMGGRIVRSKQSRVSRALVALMAAAMVAGPVLADPPPWAGGGKGKGDDRGYKGERDNDRDRDDRREERPGRHFGDRHQTIVRGYYDEEFHGGKCPPGLAKKHNGCMPPGQAKKWAVGAPLPRDEVRYELPPALVVQLGVPPAGYRYVRVASDVLMIAAGTNVVARRTHR